MFDKTESAFLCIFFCTIAEKLFANHKHQRLRIKTKNGLGCRIPLLNVLEVCKRSSQQQWLSTNQVCSVISVLLLIRSVIHCWPETFLCILNITYPLRLVILVAYLIYALFKDYISASLKIHGHCPAVSACISALELSTTYLSDGSCSRCVDVSTLFIRHHKINVEATKHLQHYTAKVQ